MGRHHTLPATVMLRSPILLDLSFLFWSLRAFRRMPDELSPTHVFQACSLNRSDTASREPEPVRRYCNRIEPMKRIQIDKKVGPARVRVSRTGGPNVSAAPARGVTLNSAHGLRLSKSWNGLQLALQNDNTRVRGRWSSKGGTNVNLSKSGLSLSQKTSFGTMNITNPNRSSVNVAGINMRGKKASETLALMLVVQALVGLVAFVAPILFKPARVCWHLVLVLGSAVLYATLELLQMARGGRAPDPSAAMEPAVVEAEAEADDD